MKQSLRGTTQSQVVLFQTCRLPQLAREVWGYKKPSPDPEETKEPGRLFQKARRPRP